MRGRTGAKVTVEDKNGEIIFIESTPRLEQIHHWDCTYEEALRIYKEEQKIAQEVLNGTKEK